MDPNRDNPLQRFKAFWVAILLVVTFAIGSLIVRPLISGRVKTAEDALATERAAVSKKIDSEQEAALNRKALADVIKEKAASYGSASEGENAGEAAE